MAKEKPNEENPGAQGKQGKEQAKSQESEESEERKSPSGRVIYETVLAEADEELSRPSFSLFWSGVAAGLSMGFSAVAPAILEAHLPEAEWTPLISKLGYSLGFLLVILGRQQLFTENTLTPILPLLRDWSRLPNVARMWLVILVANLLGACAVGLVLANTDALQPHAHEALIKIAMESMQGSFLLKILRGIFAGWLIAMIVWLLPFAEAARIWIIIILTYTISLGGFPHVIAGAVESFVLSWHGDISWAQALGGFILPTLLGNVIGGVTLVAAITHAQVTD
jgi:formate/nitrite transporter FocA (FNT family)